MHLRSCAFSRNAVGTNADRKSLRAFLRSRKPDLNQGLRLPGTCLAGWLRHSSGKPSDAARHGSPADRDVVLSYLTHSGSRHCLRCRRGGFFHSTLLSCRRIIARKFLNTFGQRGRKREDCRTLLRPHNSAGHGWCRWRRRMHTQARRIFMYSCPLRMKAERRCYTLGRRSERFLHEVSRNQGLAAWAWLLLRSWKPARRQSRR